MSDKSSETADHSYTVGNVGSGARVAVGHHISWTESGALDAGVRDLFLDLLSRIDRAEDLQEVDRQLAHEKTEEVAAALATASAQPGRLHRALLDARRFFASSATWVWQGIQSVLTSDAAQNTIGTITEASTRAAIASLLG